MQVVSNICLPVAVWPSELAKNLNGIFVVCIIFLIPLLILVYCYGRIVWVLTRRIDSHLDNPDNASQSSSSTSVNKNNRDRFQLARTNTIKTFLLVGVCFIICYCNNQVYYLMYNLGYEVDWNGTYYHFTVLMVFLNCTVNPFIYLMKYRDYQVALKDLCGIGKSNEDKSDTKKSSTSITTLSKI